MKPREEMTQTEFDQMMANGLKQAMANGLKQAMEDDSFDVDEVFSELEM